MEESRLTREQREMEPFTKLRQKLEKVKRYRDNNQKRLLLLKDHMRKVRDHMEDVNRQQNLATHKVLTGRRKT
jgi:hypothetical protein